MFTLPLTIVTSFLLTASAFYTLVAYVQLVLLEKMIKRDFPQASTFKTMSDENKKAFKKVAWKIARGLIVFVGVVAFQHFKRTGKI